MTYQEMLDTLFAMKGHFVRPDLKQTLHFAAALGNPHEAYPVIHVVGTNGKGSVATKIAETLQRSGLRVGLFTSPHLFCYRERIVINGIKISEEKVVAHLSKLFPLAKELDSQSCFFDLTFFLAVSYFKEEQVDVVVLEAGVGGLKDPTNIVQPLLTVITSIGYDHEQVLGNTLEEIASHKAGAIKPHIPVVLGPSAIGFQAVKTRASHCCSSLYPVLPVNGFYDLENQAIAKQALELLAPFFKIEKTALEQGLQARPACRFEIRGKIIFDVAHNLDGVNRLLEALEMHYPGQAFKVILGLSEDKNIREILKRISHQASHLFLVEAATPRAASVAKMGEVLESENCSNFTFNKSIAEVLDLTRNELVVVCGTFYIMQEAREQVIRSEIGIK